MRRDFDKALKARHPVLLKSLGDRRYRVPIAYDGIECGDGWYDLVDELFYAIEAALPKKQLAFFRVQQVKQKLGHLEVSYGSRKYFPLDSYDLVELQIYDAAVRSLEICEICGEPGEQREESGFLVLCDRHHRDRSDPDEAIAHARQALIDELKRIGGEANDGSGVAIEEWIDSWLRFRVPALGGRRPLDMLETEAGYARVLQTLRAIVFGVYL